jgi:uncharacterized protein (DUF983 family)
MCLLQVLGLALLDTFAYHLLLPFWHHIVVHQISYKLLLLQVVLSGRMKGTIIEVGYSNAILTF